MKGPLSALKKKWQSVWVAALSLPAIGLGFLTAAIAHIVNFPFVWAIGFALIALLILLAVAKPWLLDEAEVARIIDRENPQAEESAALLLRETGGMNRLELLQVLRLQAQLGDTGLPGPLKKNLRASVLITLALFAAAFCLLKFPNNRSKEEAFKQAHDELRPPPEKTLPAITSVSVTISPPTYTGKPPRTQQRFGLIAEKGARVKWTIGTNTTERPVLIFDGHEKMLPKPLNAEKTRWLIEKTANKNGFYQVQIGQKLSELYPIEVRPDHPPVVQIRRPGAYSTIDFGQPQQSLLQVQLSDDYGLADAVLMTTQASGKGESVKFKEEKTALQGISGKKSAGVQKLIDLKKMGLQPGDELYFFVLARDNNQQQTRSDVYIISIADTAGLMSMSGLVSGVNLVPEYFRSQRQIIIETEALIKGRDTMAQTAFRNKSNDLGFDQKVLRLRYGKFLGEENESGQPHVHDDGEQDEPAVFGDAQSIMEPYTHKHDNAEDATFFEPEQKKQLKNVLTEMWKAELSLRTFKPQEALPFEYKALRLLKDLQQSQRAYVAKTAYTPPPIKPEKRLSGELDKIGEPLVKRKTEADFTTENSLKQAASVLSTIEPDTRLSAQEVKALQIVMAGLRRRAAEKPAVYLPAVSALQAIFDDKRSTADLRKVQSALKDILPEAPPLPQPASATVEGLTGQYFKHLNRQHK